MRLGSQARVAAGIYDDAERVFRVRAHIKPLDPGMSDVVRWSTLMPPNWLQASSTASTCGSRSRTATEKTTSRSSTTPSAMRTGRRFATLNTHVYFFFIHIFEEVS